MRRSCLLRLLGKLKVERAMGEEVQEPRGMEIEVEGVAFKFYLLADGTFGIDCPEAEAHCSIRFGRSGGNGQTVVNFMGRLMQHALERMRADEEV